MSLLVVDIEAFIRDAVEKHGSAIVSDHVLGRVDTEKTVTQLVESLACECGCTVTMTPGEFTFMKITEEAGE